MRASPARTTPFTHRRKGRPRRKRIPFLRFEDLTPIQQAWILWCEAQKLRFWCTGTFNRAQTLIQVEKALIHFHAVLDRDAIGKNFFRVSGSQRTVIVAFVENLTSNAHVHLFISPVDEARFKIIGADKWEKLAPGGDLEISSVWDYRGAGTYSMKDALDDCDFTTILIVYRLSSVPPGQHGSP